MGYSVKNDGTGWKWADTPEEVDENSYFLSTEDGPPPEPVPLPPTPIELIALANARRDELLALAAIRIAPLQDAVDLDDATAAETALLKKWKQYRVTLNRLDLAVDPIGWPEIPI